MDEDEEDNLDIDNEEGDETSRKTAAKKRATPPTKPISKAEKDAIRNAEKERSSKIRSIGTKFNMEETFIDEHLDGDTSVEAFRELVMDKWESQDPAKGIRNENKLELKTDEKDKLVKVRSTALAVRTGQIALKDIKDVELRSEAQKMQSIDLFRMAELSVRESGVDTSYMPKSEIARRAIAPQSTGMFPETLNALVNTILLQNYEEEEDLAYEEFTSTGTLSDFKEYGAIRSWGLDNLKRVNETEEYEQIPLRDAVGEKMRLFKHGGIVSLSWEAIVNDDLGHFSNLLKLLGQTAKRTLKDNVYARLLENGQRGPLMADGKALYHVDHFNLMAPQASLTETVIDSMRIAMKTKKDNNGKTVAFRPSILLVNPIEFTIAKRYNNSPVSIDATNKSSLLDNPIAGTFDKVIESESVPAGYRYVFDRPTREEVVRINYLDGERAPVIERHEEFRSDAISWKERFVFGVSAVGFNGTLLLPNA